MKKGYVRLLVFECLVCIVLLLNSFVWNILSGHIMNLFLLVLIILFKIFFGFEKDRHRYVKDVLMDIFIFLIIFFMLYYLLGIIVSFVKPGNYYSLEGLFNFIIPTIFYVILKEFLRYNVLMKGQGNKITVIASIILFILIDISTAIFYRQFNSNYNVFIFIALTLLPAISNNLAFSYITMNVGYKPVMFYSLIMSLYYYLMPIIPNPNDYIMSVINLLLPLIFCYRFYRFVSKSRDEEIDRDYKRYHFGWLFLSSFIVVVLVYFTSGYFKFWAIAVASGSMSPAINKGDVAIIEKIDGNFDKIKKGDVLAFKYNKVTIVHRVVNIVFDKGIYYFYTKGDANRNEDNFKVDSSMIIGVVNMRVPFIGSPTVWLNEL